MGSSIVDPRMLGELPAFYPARCTIQSEGAEGQLPSGEPRSGDWEDVDGLEDIPCAVGPAGQAEIRRPDGTVRVATHRIALQGHFPAIKPEMRAVVGSDVFDIVQVAHDSQGQSTSLDVERVR